MAFRKKDITEKNTNLLKLKMFVNQGNRQTRFKLNVNPISSLNSRTASLILFHTHQISCYRFTITKNLKFYMDETLKAKFSGTEKLFEQKRALNGVTHPKPMKIEWVNVFSNKHSINLG